MPGRLYLNCLSYHVCSIRPCGAPSPGGKGYDTRIPSSKKAAKPPPRETIHSPRIVIPSAAEGSLLHGRHRHTCALTQTTPWCFLFRLSLTHGLPVCKKDPSTSVGMTRIKNDSLTSFFMPCLPYPLPPYRHPERSRGIFIALPPYARMHPHSSDTLVLPFSPFSHSRFTSLVGMTGGRRVVSHSFSPRYMDPSCAFGAALLQFRASPNKKRRRSRHENPEP